MQKVGGFVFVSAEEMRGIDRMAIEDYHVDVLSLMENAGVAVATMARHLLGGSLFERRIACLAGKGNNGGDGLVASRHLMNWGATVSIASAFPTDELGNIARRQLEPLTATYTKVLPEGASLSRFDLLIDSLLGYNSRGPPREPIASLIRRANESSVPILAVDIPSGLDPDTGVANEPCIHASATLTLALPKTGFLNAASDAFVGDLYLGDVSIPWPLYSRLGQESPPFAKGPIVRVPKLGVR